MPGNRGFSRVVAIAATVTALRPHSVTSRPARAAIFASALPQAPAPTTPIWLKVIAWPRRLFEPQIFQHGTLRSLPPCGGGLGRRVCAKPGVCGDPPPYPSPARGFQGLIGLDTA